MMKPLIEIDGERIEYTDFYPKDECICGMQYGLVYGIDEFPWPDGGTASKECKPVGVVNIYRSDENGIWDFKVNGVWVHKVKGRWGHKAIYKDAYWTVGEDDIPLLRLSERIT